MAQLQVAHFCPSYLPLSETFIYRYLTNFKEVTPTVFAGNFENLDHFPLSHELYEYCHKRFTARWFVNGLGRRLFGIDDLHRKMIIRRNRVKLLHAHFGPTGFSLLKLKNALNLPLITTFYGYDMSSLPKLPQWQANYAELFSQGDLFLVEGNHMKKDLVALGCPEDKIRIQHIAIDTEQFAFRPRLPKGDQEIVLLFCGRFTEKKGLIYALQAFANVHTKYPNIRFRIIGDGELRPDVEAYIDSNGLKDAVDLLGYQPQSAVAAEMACADIFVQPSVTAASGDTEGGAPTILLEAQAAGVPVLSTLHADIPEVVVDGHSAFLSKEKDWEGLSANLIYLIEHQDQWKQFGKAGRHHVIENYDIRNEVLRLESIYNDLV